MLNTEHHTINNMCYQTYPIDDDCYPCFNRLSLWSFIFDLLEEQRTPCVRWTDREKLEFKIEDTEGLAQEWGQRKGKNTMTWAKFARAMRYYYGKDVLEKVERKRFTYKFIDSPKTRAVIRSKGRLTNPSSPVSSADSSSSTNPSIISDEDYVNISKSIDILNPATITTVTTASPCTYEQDKIELIKKELEISVTQCMDSLYAANPLYTSNSFTTQTSNNTQSYTYQQSLTNETPFTLPYTNYSSFMQQQQPTYSPSPSDQKVPNVYSSSHFDEYFSEEEFSPQPSHQSNYQNEVSNNHFNGQNSLTPCERAILASLVDSFHDGPHC